MFCPKCGAQNPDGAKFCHGCGTPLSAPEAPAAQAAPIIAEHQSYQQQVNEQISQAAQPVGEVKKKPLGLIIGIITAVLIAGIGLATFLIINSGDSVKKDDSSSKSGKSKVVDDDEEGDTTETSTSTKKPKTTTAPPETTEAPVETEPPETEPPETEPLPADPGKELQNDGRTYNIYCWNEEFKNRFEKYYWPNRDTDLWEGVDVQFVVKENVNNMYQDAVDEKIRTLTSTPNEDRMDLFLVEADYAKKYVNSEISLDVIGEIGLTGSDLSDQFNYTKDVMIDDNGILKGVSWQATPGLFIYRSDYAKKVLGTDDPAKVQNMVSDWTKFEQVAEKMKASNIFTVAGPDDLYRVFSNNVSAPWVVDGKVRIDEKLDNWVTLSKKWYDYGYCSDASLWDDNWKGNMKMSGNVFGYFFPCWGIDYVLKINTESDGYGMWRAVPGPQTYFWGGTWLCGAYGSDNVAITRDIMLKLTCDKDIMADITVNESDFTNNRSAIKQLIDEGYSNDFLGGQKDYLGYLMENAEKLDLTNKLSPYDQGCTEAFQGEFDDYIFGQSSYKSALAIFKDRVRNIYKDLDLSGI